MSSIKRVVIIGGGPSGVAAAKHLIAENHFTQIDIFDQGSKPGGVWDYVPENNSHSTCAIPQTSPNVPLPKPIWRDTGVNGYTGKRATYVSPMYDLLESNIPKTLMQHSTHSFSATEPLFPSQARVEDYLVSYAREITPLITWETQLTSAIPDSTASNTSQATWTISTLHLPTNESTTRHYDALLIASGHYNVPFLPDMPGISAWNEAYPGVITHSKAYSAPSTFAGKKVLIVGNGPSGLDIAAQIASTCASPLLISTRSDPNPVFRLPEEKARYVGAIDSFLSPSTSTSTSSPSPGERAVKFSSGDIETDIQAIVFCTGYIYSYPFLPQPPHSASQPPFDKFPIITNGDRVHNVYQHMFYNALPSLAFLGLPWMVTPFQLAESQSAVISRVWSGRLNLPSQQEMVHWENKGEETWGKGKVFHRMKPPRDGEYINALYEWAMTASGEAERKEGRKGAGESGKANIPYWDERMFWIRKEIPNIKKAYQERGEDRKKVTSLEELGFVYPGDDAV